MSATLSVEQQKRILSQLLKEVKRSRRISSFRDMARQIGVSHVTLLAWVNEESLPRPDAAVKLGEFLGYTNTPYWEFLEGDLRDLKLLMMDRLTNLLIQLPANAREKVFRQWEASLAEELRYIESSSQSATTETELPV